MKILGILIIIFGLVDVGGSFAGFDLWRGYLGVNMPDMLWKFSGYIELAIGYFLMSLGSKKDTTAED